MTVFVTSFRLLMDASVKNSIILVVTVVDVFMYLVLLVWTVGVIGSHLRDIQGMVLMMYCDNPFNPVSYTHLDVYKRQTLHHLK